jgi:uncharacterized protein YjbI with pentapeptide repeats
LVVFFAIGASLLLVFLNWYVAPTKASERKDLVLALAQILAGTALLAGLYFTWRTLQVNREGQITERFTRAIDQLGSKELEVRLGGIYALERIARDSERDHWTIMEILTTYVRQHAPWLSERGLELLKVLEAAAVENAEAGTSAGSESTEVPSLAPETQAILTVIRRRERYFGHGEPDPLDLHETALVRAVLWEADLTMTNLSGANLMKANLTGANLSRANLMKANLWRANLRKWSYNKPTNLSSARLMDAFLREADLTGANLAGAVLMRADLTGANLIEANLTDANLTEANLMRARLARATLTGLSGATLTRANLTEANLWGADLTGAVLGADLTEANLTRADLTRADLTGACLTGACLTQEQLDRVIGSNETQIPEGLTRPKAWSESLEVQMETLRERISADK